jgi:hypothetical protein
MIKKILIIFPLLAFASCGPYWYKPHGKIFTFLPKGGTPGFELGWMHGCESGLSTQFAGAFYKSFYSWKRDPYITKTNKTSRDVARIREKYKDELEDINWRNRKEVEKNFSDYNTIFWAAHAFCRHYTVGQLLSSDMTPPIPGDERVTFRKGAIGNVYKIDGRGDGRLGNGYW